MKVGIVGNMTKLEYQTITILLKEKEYCEEVLRGFKELPTHSIESTNIGKTRKIVYLMDSVDEEFFVKYFENKLKEVNKSLKRLGYDD